MSETPSRKDSISLAERLFRDKERWHKKQARMSFEKKLEALERLRLRARELAHIRKP